MSYYSITTPDMKRSGTAKVLSSETVDTPYNFLGPDIVSLFQTNVPFSMLFTQYEKDSDTPFQLTMLAPDFSMYTSLSQEEFECAVRGRPLHQHNTYELMYVLSGTLFQRIENERHRYEEKSCCLINRAVRHAEEYEISFHSVNLSLSRDLLITILNEGEQSYFRAEKQHMDTDLANFLRSEFQKDGSSEKKYIDFHPRFGSDEMKKKFSHMFGEITKMTQMPGPGSSLLIRAMIYQILTYLNDKYYYDTVPIQLGTPAESRLFNRITSLMEETDGRISRSELAEKLNYSGNYLNRIVHTYTGMSLFDYGCSFTMQKAGTLLRDTNQTVSDIMAELKFTDRTHFYNLFRREYDMTPKEFRKALRKSV